MDTAHRAAPEPATRPHPGRILLFAAARVPSGPLDWVLTQPLAVMLAEPAGHPDIWYGWLMAAETDYASHWDLLLEPGDGPQDPGAAMVQVGNPVHCNCPAANAARGLLTPTRLAAVRDLAVDFLIAHPDPVGADPGVLVQRRTSGGHRVLTGTPPGDGQDPRWRYQALYFTAADFVRDLARQALAELAPAPAWWQRVLEALRGAAQRWQWPLELVPMPAMGPESAQSPALMTWRLGDRFAMPLPDARPGTSRWLDRAADSARYRLRT